MKNRRITALALSLVMILMMASGCVKENKESAAAVVNGDEISIAEFEKNLEIYKNMYESQYGDIAWDEEIEEGVTYLSSLKENVIENMIMDTIMLQEAAKNGVEVTDEELQSLFEEYKAYYGDEETYNESLASSGMDEAFLLEYLKNGEIIDRYVSNFVDTIEINDEILESYFDENKDKFVAVNASHILVNSLEEAQDILAKLYDGADFGEMAMEYSQDPGSAGNGGELGYFYKGQMVAEFEEVAFSVEPGELSGIVSTTYGFHILKVNDRKESLEDNYDIVFADYQNAKYTEKLEELKSNADIERFIKTN
ncbi:foldase protein PrsA [Dethiosulfatibacter aminovorans DSM 17477]|uniref:Foldase protein PrsA n=1 Tax=Dethiosulfatibacter aminovorans DSM 17477 TaxID=1121476 RepID=A0A1M6KC55_9FIRM|nr:peptidylprolyl isomerase [Dethiosulfatibacter aminovorans]SHJ56546.1 foldase protein PrsA [Dethiosulfatibacter aminovorans DSM 17477]